MSVRVVNLLLRGRHSVEQLIRNAFLFADDTAEKKDILIKDGVIVAAEPHIPGDAALDLKGACVFPGFADAHVHLREPGFSYKETIFSGTRAAAHGGYAAVCAMPNLSPAPDCVVGLEVQREIIRRDGAVGVFPFGTITKGENGAELADLEAVAPFVCGFSDDGRGVQSEDIMRQAMKRLKPLGKIVAAHCEDESCLPRGWCVNDGAAARRFGLVGNPSQSEWQQVARDLALARETGCPYHVCHVSTAESVSLIRLAKAEGLDVTCETAPHYLVLCDEDLSDDGRFRMNPPIRSRRDQDALLEGICDGTIDMVSTDHAPHSAAEKSGGLAHSLNGIVGLECAFSVLYTKLVLGKILSLERLTELFTAASRRFGLGLGSLHPGDPADLTAFDLEKSFTVTGDEFLSKGRSTPFEGWTVSGRCLLTLSRGRTAFIDTEILNGGGT